METVLVDGVVAAADVDVVARGRPGGGHAPDGDVAREGDAGDGSGAPPVPDAQRAVDGGVEEGGG